MGGDYVDWITDNIAIGNFLDAREAIVSRSLDAILCLKPECCDEGNEDLQVLCVPLEDGFGNTKYAIDMALHFIHDAVSSDEKILVHCHAGRSRSVCVVAVYLAKYGGYTRDSALALIRGKREIYLSDGIEEIFILAGL